ncbi:MAG: S8 family serine peptidase [Candidatus Promineifilaceae bacterium]
MNRPKDQSLFILLAALTALVLVLAIGPSPEPAAAEQGSYFVRIPDKTADSLGSLNLHPVEEITYPSFHWLELSPADYQKLAASSDPYTLNPNGGTVQITSFKFDPLVDGEPPISAALTTTNTGAGLRLVQFDGPIKADWLAGLESAGLRPLQYYPHNAYLVWGTAAQTRSAESLDYVRWQGPVQPAYKINSDLFGKVGRIENIDIVFYNDGSTQQTLNALSEMGAVLQLAYPSQPDKAFYDAVIQVDAAFIDDIARLDTVLWLGYMSPDPILDDEMSAQIIAGNHPGGVPQVGYMAHLANLGFDGTGVIWSITDTGVDYDHPDLNVVGGHNYPGCIQANPGEDTSTGGHGTHVAGIVGGDGTGGFSDVNGFLYGIGIAPGVSLFAQNPICGTQSSWPPAGGWQELSKQGVLGNAIGANNSWTSGEGTNHGYQSTERTHDFMVRDGNFDTSGTAEPYILVFSAGNSGPNSNTLTSPKEAKNLIVVAGTQNYRVSGNIDAMYNSSSRGPSQDGRYVPTIATPGQQIASTRNDQGGLCSSAISGTNGLYAYCTGTSMASPHAAGTIALVTEWWRTWNAGADPSPAMAKALLVNSAVDISGAPPIPNFSEGWGRVNATEIISSGVATIYRDQLDLFDNTGETWTLSTVAADPSKPLKITLAWADAPGAVGANPALVNDLDLTVEMGGNTYMGNVFSNGWSTTGGNADSRNNLENVYLQNPSGNIQITVEAVNIAGDGIPLSGDTTDQDFVLICYNCDSLPVIYLSANSLDGMVQPGDAITRTLTISNTGLIDLDWTITEGSPAVEGGCGTPGELPWVEITPTNGTTPPDDGTEITAVFDSTDLPSGIYNGELCVSSNDPSNPEITINLKLTIFQTDYSLYLPVISKATTPGVSPP